ncbi:MAG: RNA-binding domain-containing protein [Nitrososphaerales archaeon]
MLQFSSVTIMYLIHATEDSDRLEKAVCAIFGIETSDIASEKLGGYYGNELLMARAHIVGKRASEIVSRIADRLTESTRKEITARISSSMDEHDALYLRFDRQKILEGLSDSDDEPIRIKIKPKIRFGGCEAMKEAYISELKSQ